MHESSWLLRKQQAKQCMPGPWQDGLPPDTHARNAPSCKTWLREQFLLGAGFEAMEEGAGPFRSGGQLGRY